jgi:hypothetical protein
MVDVSNHNNPFIGQEGGGEEIGGAEKAASARVDGRGETDVTRSGGGFASAGGNQRQLYSCCFLGIATGYP